MILEAQAPRSEKYGPHGADHENGDNEILLEQPNWRQDEQSKSRQPPDEVRR